MTGCRPGRRAAGRRGRLTLAEHDVLRDEGERYAQRLREAHVPVLHRRFPQQMHDFLVFVNVLPGSDDGIAFVVEAIQKRLAEANG